jgi:hypothetical protein
MRNCILCLVLLSVIACGHNKKYKGYYTHDIPFLHFHLSVPESYKFEETFHSREWPAAVYRKVDSANAAAFRKQGFRYFTDTAVVDINKTIADPKEWFINVDRPGAWRLNYTMIVAASYQDTSVVLNDEKMKDSTFLVNYLGFPSWVEDRNTILNHEVDKKDRRFMKITSSGVKRQNITWAGMVGKYWVLFKSVSEDPEQTKTAEQMWRQSYFD